MSRIFCVFGTILFAMALLSLGCNLGEEQPPPAAQVQPMAPPVQQVPVPPPAPVVAPAPPTPLIPIEPTPVAVSKGGGGGGGINAPIGGEASDGADLVGNYSCTFNAKGLPIGPFQLPPFSCRIYQAQDGSLKVGQAGRSGSTKIHGNVLNPTDKGFFIVGKYTFPGNSIGVKARMLKKAGAKPTYSGRGRSALNDSSTRVNYTLKMERK